MTPEDVNRERVATHLADILWEAGATTADDIANLEPFVWRLAVAEVRRRQAVLAERWECFVAARPEPREPKPWQPKDSYEPSDQTRVMVAGMVRYRERHTTVTPTDPFEGLPS